jgi:hypothetical protein
MSSIKGIPDYSDLGKVDAVTKNTWSNLLAKYSEYEYYYSGRVFDEKVEDSELADPPSLYPVGINIVKMLCDSMASATFGEYDHLPIWFGTRRGVDESSHTIDASKLLDRILFQSDAESALLEMEIQRMLFGASVLKIRPSIKRKGVEWLPIKPSSFFPVFDPHNKNRLIEAHVSNYISRAQAKLFYGYDGKKDEVLFEEEWTLRSHKVVIDGKMRIEKYSGRNPYGVVPFVYIPRARSVSKYGDSLADDIIPVQDELNMRIADIGEAVNYNAHPIRYGLNLPHAFNASNYPVGSDSLWDLGRSFGDHKPEIGVLEVKNPVPQGAVENVEWLYDWVRTSTFAPPIAFGEDNGGGQRSGATLEIRMWPLIKAVRKHRAYLRTGMRHAAYITGKILRQKDWARPRVLDALINSDIEAQFADIMPRDRAAIVDEVVKRLATKPPTISLESALKKLGADSVEEDRIREMLEEYDIELSKKSEAPEEENDIEED